MAVEDQKTFSEAWQYCDRVSGSKGKLFEPHSSTNDIVKNMYQGRLAKSWIGVIEYDSRNFVFHSDVSSLTWENWSYQRNESCLSSITKCYLVIKELQNLLNFLWNMKTLIFLLMNALYYVDIKIANFEAFGSGQKPSISKEYQIIDKHDFYTQSSRIFSTTECAVMNLNTGKWDYEVCSSSVTNQFICEMKTDIELETPKKVYIVVDITREKYVKKDSQIMFDEVIMDQTGSWNKTRSRFVPPWVGNFTFCKVNFKCTGESNRHIQARIDDSHSDVFNLEDDNDSGKMTCTNLIPHQIQKRDDYIAFYRDYDTVTFKCSKTKPCRLIIQGVGKN